MIGPNLSDWALKHRSFIVFAMIAIVVAGLMSYFRLGRSEDPAFTFRAMVVQAAWPGATLDDTLDPGDRASRAQAPGDQGPRFPALLHQSGPDDDLRQSQGIDLAQGRAGHLVSGAQEDRRHPPHPAAGRGRAGLQRRIRRHLRPDLRLYRRRRLQPSRTARLCRGYSLAAAAGARRFQDRDPGRAGRADLSSNSRPASSPASASTARR